MLAVAAAELNRTPGAVVSMAGPHVCAPIDANGNLESDGGRSVEWNAQNQLTALVLGNDRIEFAYNGALQRAKHISKQNGVVQSEVHFVPCDGDICEERTVSGTPSTRRMFAAGDVVAAARFVTRDHLGSIRDVTDSPAVITDRNEFDPWGRPTATAGSLSRSTSFADLQFEPSSGLLAAQFRIYDPSIGRWFSEDPSRFADGPNLFSYVKNRVLTYADPAGLQGALIGPPQVIRTPQLPRGCTSPCGCTIFTGDKDYNCNCSAAGGFELQLWAYASATIYIDSDRWQIEWIVESHENKHVQDFITRTTWLLSLSGARFPTEARCHAAAAEIFKEFDERQANQNRVRHGFFQKIFCPENVLQ